MPKEPKTPKQIALKIRQLKKQITKLEKKKKTTTAKKKAKKKTVKKKRR
jgi:hypothetical protein